MSRFIVHDEVTVQLAHVLHGEVTATFPAGEVSPSSEQELAALEALVASGHAELIEGDAEHDPAEPRFPEAEGETAKPRRRRKSEES